MGLLANMLVNPPQGFSVTESASAPKTGKEMTTKPSSNVNVTPLNMINSINFYILWTIFFVGSGAGLMVIGSVVGMAKKGKELNLINVVALFTKKALHLVQGFFCEKRVIWMKLYYYA